MTKSFKYIVLALGFASLTSCDFLDQVADERTDIAINSEADENKLVMLMNTAYPEGNYTWIAEISSDNLMDNQCPHYPSSPNSKQVENYYNRPAMAKYDDELFHFEPANTANTSEWDSPSFIWGLYYGSIATCNYTLQEAYDWVKRNNGQMSNTVKAVIAEAKLVRAYDHFILANLFCQAYKNPTDSRNDVGLPYVTTVETKLINEYERGNVADLYQSIEKDLEEGLADVSDLNYGKAHKYHFNVKAAKAFAARYYLYTRQYDKVIKYANDILGTDSVSVASKLINYADFTKCVYASDYGNVWQSVQADNNIMLICTASLYDRKIFGYRYSYAGEKCKEALMVRSGAKLWKDIICPVQSIVSGMLFASSSSDYGYYSTKNVEEFEYSDKIAGIGTPHVVMRAFTCQELLLERAEAKILSGDITGGFEDLKLYWNSAYDRMSETSRKEFGKYFVKILGDEGERIVRSYYGAKSGNPNCFEDWTSFTSTMGPDFVVPTDAIPFMNMLNDFRRYETCYEGLRFFDIKRWGMPYEHNYGDHGKKMTIEVPSSDLRRAVEVPWEALSSGFASSRSQVKVDTRNKSLRMNIKDFILPPVEN